MKDIRSIYTIFFLTIFAAYAHADVHDYLNIGTQEQVTPMSVNLVQWLKTGNLQQPRTPTTQSKLLACVDDAGMLTTTVDGTTINNSIFNYVNYGSTVSFIHSGGDASGDTIPTTLPGFDIAIYVAPPTASGATAANINADVAYTGSVVGTKITGDTTFQNLGGYQTAFNTGDPVHLWFAPITLDDHANQLLTENAGSPTECVNVAIAEQINMVFLNQINIFNFTNPAVANGDSCVARFLVEGGLPERDASNFTITIHLTGDPTTTATITSPPATEQSLVEFNVPEAGMYDVVVSDNNGATRTFQVDMGGCAVCNDNAGTIASTTLNGGAQSPNPVYLCQGDALSVAHFGDAVLTGDPNTFTTPGLGYVMYTDQPTLTPTNDVVSIASDPNIVNSGGNCVGFDVVGQSTNGNFTIINDGMTYQNLLGGIGGTGQLWFAPITLDDFNNACNFESTGTPNECSNVNVGAAFPVVFLNSIMVGGITDNMCDGTFSVSGGLPQYDNSNYVITIELSTDPTITGTVTNATPPDHGGTVNFTVPQPGTYNITVTDTLGCTSVSNTHLIFPDMDDCPFPCDGVVNATLNVTSNHNGAAISCNGESNGALGLSIVGGVAPLTIVWSHDAGNTTTSASGLSAGTYSVTVTDANGCIDTPTIVLNDPDTIAIDLDSTPVLCNGDTTSSVFVAGITGGTAPYFYSWSDGTVGPANTITNVGAGTYTVTVTDANNCIGTQTLVLTEPTPLTTMITDTMSTDCDISENGMATVVPSGGTVTNNDYTFSWSHDMLLEDSVATNLASGTYYVTVTDDNGCQAVDSVIIVELKSIDIALTSVDVLCAGDATGSITANVTTNGGAANLPYIYSWSHDNTIITNTASNLPAGNYCLTVTDALGCSNIECVNIAEPDSLIITVPNVSDIDCAGDPDGSATISVTGGVVPYTYSWTNSASDSATLENALAGTYIVTVTDSNGCMIPQSITINENPAIVVTNVVTNELDCAGDTDGGFTVTASGGTGTLTYAWSTNPTLDTSNAITGLGSGTYQLTITDVLGCEEVETYTLSDPLPLSGVITAPDLTCADDQSGIASIVMSGGTAPYFYAWSGGTPTANGDSITGLVTGQYTVTVTDAHGCTYTDVATIDAPPAIAISVTTTQVSCTNPSSLNGTATATVSGGTGGYTYLWDSTQTGQTATQLAVGQHILIVTDQSGCQMSDTFTITSVAPLSLTSIESNTVSCFGGNDGSAYVEVTGGTEPYSYAWSTNPTQDSSTAVGLTQGIYEVSITDANGCALTPISITINEPPALVIDTIITSDPLCNNSNDGSITVIPQGGTPSYSYDWTNSTSITNTANDLFAGQYTVTVTDANGCTTTGSALLGDPLILIAQLSTTGTSCNGGKDGRIQVDTVLGGTGPYTYSIDGTSFLPTDITYFGLFGGNYEVTVMDANGCTFVQEVLIDEPPLIVVDLGPDVEIDLGDSTQLQAFVNTIDSLTYTWTSFDTLMSCTDCPDPIVRPVATTEYFVTVVDTNGCQASDDITVIIDKNRRVFIPNGFSPNGDGINDRFIIYGGTGVEEIISFKVFDRWGELVHASDNFAPGSYADGWDGFFEGRLMNPGVFVYYAEIRFSDGEVFPYKGDVTLMR